MKAILNDETLKRVDVDLDPYNGAAVMYTKTGLLRIIFSNGMGWDHVSVSRSDRCPTWDEMCMVKERFFDSEDCVVQFHPPKSKYKNIHPYCLHLWKIQDGQFPMPDIMMV